MNFAYNKFHNQPVKAEGFSFDSKKEYRRYKELKLLADNGEITNLQVHPRFEIVPAFKRNGKTIKATYYEADFMYIENGFEWKVEDVKGAETDLWKLKRKLFLLKYPDHELRVIKDA